MVHVIAANLRDRTGEHENETGVWMHMPGNPLFRFVLHLGKKQPTDFAPAQDVAVGEVLGRLVWTIALGPGSMAGVRSITIT